MPRVVIIGAGLTGISTAYHLEQHNFFDYVLYEKEPSIGGLCRSIQQDGYTFDYTGHLLHASDPYFSNFITKTIGADQFNSIDRRSFVYSHERYTPYPYQMHLRSLPTPVIADCIEGFIVRNKDKTIENFVDWVEHAFGAGFGRHFFIPYQTKIFACDPHTITASWTSRFVPDTSLHDIIDGLQGITKKTGYNASFLYPKKGGIMSWVATFAQQLQKKIETSTAITEINLKEKKVILNDGSATPYELLINTIPLDSFLRRLKEPSDTSLRNAAEKLRCNSVINFNLGIKNRNVSDKHWIYFPEEQYPFYRLGFPHNFAQSMTPPDCSSLYGEFAHLGQSTTWVTETTKHAITQTKKLLAITDDEIDTTAIITIPHAYVIYDQWREKNIPSLLDQLTQNRIYSIGRYGAWKYSSMQEAVLDGKAMAETIIDELSRVISTNALYPLQKGKNHVQLPYK